MYGEPEDVPGECNAHLYIGDDWGDNHATMRCHLPAGHEGPHKEVFREGTVKVTWEKDERCNCPKHGRQNSECCEQCDKAETEAWRLLDRYADALNEAIEKLEGEDGAEFDDSGPTSEG